MVFYYTSANVKLLRKIIKDYEATGEVSPHEYMAAYIEKYPKNDEEKHSWIVGTFLGYYKHRKFLTELTKHLTEEMSATNYDYFTILLYAIIFEVDPADKGNLYKCIFNLSKSLLHIFMTFFTASEVLNFIARISQSNYDTHFITEKIIGPLIKWEPCIHEMAESYSEYMKKIKSKKKKPPTVPIQPNVLSRTGKEKVSCSAILPTSSPNTPPNSEMRVKKKMLTKSTIDERLKVLHEKNQEKCKHLLKYVKNKDFSYARKKTDAKHAKVIEETQYELRRESRKPKQINSLKACPSIKHTTATIKLLDKRMQKEEENEIKWFESIMQCNGDTLKVDELLKQEREDKKRERLLEIQRKHLMGQITYEEAILAKQKVQDENKKKYEDYLKERDAWNNELEIWKRSELERNRKLVEKHSIDELKLLESKTEAFLKKKTLAEEVKKENEMIIAKAMKQKREELERKINTIKEIRLLSMIAQKTKAPKMIDFTETAGFGFLSEMSIAELQERLSAMKMMLRDNLEQKKSLIKHQNQTAKEQLQETKSTVENFMKERAMLRESLKPSEVTVHTESLPEIEELKRTLQEKRNLRMQKAAFLVHTQKAAFQLRP